MLYHGIQCRSLRMLPRFATLVNSPASIVKVHMPCNYKFIFCPCNNVSWATEKNLRHFTTSCDASFHASSERPKVENDFIARVLGYGERSQFNSIYRPRSWKKKSNFVRSSWCLSLYVQLFSYNFKLCVFLFASFGILEMRAQHQHLSVFRVSGFFEKLKNTFLFLVVCLPPNPTLTYFLVFAFKQWHGENFHHLGKFISTQRARRERKSAGEWKQ